MRPASEGAETTSGNTTRILPPTVAQWAVHASGSVSIPRDYVTDDLHPRASSCWAISTSLSAVCSPIANTLLFPGLMIKPEAPRQPRKRCNSRSKCRAAAATSSANRVDAHRPHPLALTRPRRPETPTLGATTPRRPRRKPPMRPRRHELTPAARSAPPRQRRGQSPWAAQWRRFHGPAPWPSLHATAAEVYKWVEAGQHFLDIPPSSADPATTLADPDTSLADSTPMPAQTNPNVGRLRPAVPPRRPKQEVHQQSIVPPWLTSAPCSLGHWVLVSLYIPFAATTSHYLGGGFRRSGVDSANLEASSAGLGWNRRKVPGSG